MKNAVPESDIPNPPLSGPVYLSIPLILSSSNLWMPGSVVSSPLPDHTHAPTFTPVCHLWKYPFFLYYLPCPPTPPHPTDCPTPSSSLLCVILTLPSVLSVIYTHSLALHTCAQTHFTLFHSQIHVLKCTY